MKAKHTNALIKETSPYLLQHANNPVDWKPWNSDALQQAKDQNKLILISIGYAACHWCHVMEHESFEDLEVSKVMNDNFINIKVDREERPDIDQVYMSAVQLMTGQGGWPLNIIALPDGRPIWGGTYFPKQHWMGSLHQLADLYASSPEQMITYAEKLHKGIEQVALVQKVSEHNDISTKRIQNAVHNWEQKFDYERGGTQGAPKFMMPNNYHFLMRYAFQTKNKNISDYVRHTLTKISYGGVYDHVGGGFSRYSVDDKWHVPHFEKMLYDNAQLISLYADAYLIYKEDWFKDVIEETLDFVAEELTRDNGSFYSSLDADSLNAQDQLEEGAYYVWTEDELKTLIANDYQLFKQYYNINDYGYWEHNNYVLIRNNSDETMAKQFSISIETLQQKVKSWKYKLKQFRSKRDKPRLDDKSLTSWNALMITGYLDAYRVLGHEKYLQIALKNANFLMSEMQKEDGGLWHSYNRGEAKINGYLEDYATVIQSFISLYEHTADLAWLEKSKALTNYVFTHFYNDETGMFYFTSSIDDDLVSRHTEHQDNVIPASNSIMAKNLFSLSHFYPETNYKAIATQQLQNVLEDAQKYAGGYSNWLDLALNYAQPYYEAIVVGKNAHSKVKKLQQEYTPNVLLAWSTKAEDLGLFKNRLVNDKTLIYICQNNACNLPTREPKQALKLIRKQ